MTNVLGTSFQTVAMIIRTRHNDINANHCKLACKEFKRNSLNDRTLDRFSQGCFSLYNNVHATSVRVMFDSMKQLCLSLDVFH